jgi:hypothetical protein
MRIADSFAVAALCVLVACTTDTESGDDEASSRHRVESAGAVTCYTEAAPANTCSLPAHCCFTTYARHHDGHCSQAECLFGTIACDGPEDCRDGERCCGHAITSSLAGTIGYSIACRASCDGPLAREICHPETGCSRGTCVNAYGVDNDLPRTLYVCE